MESGVKENHNGDIKRAGLTSVALLLPALFSLYLALTASPLSVRDYWAIIEPVYSTSGFSPELSDWFIPQNGHIVFIPRLIYALNIVITDGSNIGLTLTAWFLALGQTVMLVSLIPPDIRDFRIRLLLVAAISGFSFAPTATSNWMQGFSGVPWLLANVFSIGVIICIAKFFKHGNYSWVVGSLLLGGLALITYGTAIGAWIALVAAFIFMRSRLPAGLLVAGITMLVIAVSLASRPYVPPSAMILSDQMIVFGPYLATLLGGIFSTIIPLAFMIGVIALVIGAAVMIKFGFFSAFRVRLTVLAWLLVMVYSLVNLTFIAITRLKFGLEYATTMRYVTLSGLFWIGLIVIGAYWHLGARKQYSWYALLPYGVAIPLLLLAMVPLGLHRAQRLTQEQLLQRLAILSINLDVPDQQLVEIAIINTPHAFLNQVPALKANELIPFRQPFRSQGGKKIGDPLPLSAVSGATPVQGTFEFVDPVTPNGVRAVGWIAADPDAIESMVLVNQDGLIRGKALPGFNWPAGDTKNQTGWVGYAHLNSPDEELTVYVKTERTTFWTPLAQTRSRENPGQVRPEVYVALVGGRIDEYVGLESFNELLQSFGYTAP